MYAVAVEGSQPCCRLGPRKWLCQEQMCVHHRLRWDGKSWQSSSAQASCQVYLVQWVQIIAGSTGLHYVPFCTACFREGRPS